MHWVSIIQTNKQTAYSGSEAQCGAGIKRKTAGFRQGAGFAALLRCWTWTKIERAWRRCQYDSGATSLMELAASLRSDKMRLLRERSYFLAVLIFQTGPTLDRPTCAKPPIYFLKQFYPAVKKLKLVDISIIDANLLRPFCDFIGNGLLQSAVAAFIGNENCRYHVYLFLVIKYCTTQSSTGTAGAWVSQVVVPLRKKEK